MKFFAAALLFAATVVALPQPGDVNTGGNKVKYPVSNKTTLKQAQNTCGNDAKVSCCNEATYTKDVTNNANGPLAGVLQSALGAGSGGLGLFGQCNDLSLNVPVLNVVGGGLDQLVEQKCKQNIACCQDTKSDANGNLIGVAIPCVALGSLI
ncbi:conidial hydrophobin Hyp1/RodA [Penicillium angulare]|uniref:conidial hydrophobin Hyp1/RodA n=1 Tax=Penicillium angulare TaxID=116970 RepID=UPI002540F503|nr:conidial hydrophobin Hyp1/RodA [Penicillium angulare]KAJ5259591.1 conidial hydrophobin Hyp1/RodA [Penicillium angulare]